MGAFVIPVFIGIISVAAGYLLLKYLSAVEDGKTDGLARAWFVPLGWGAAWALIVAGAVLIWKNLKWLFF
ncbi:MAG: hypothetical protein GXO27_06765 [Chlorobi bacterium]|nr:hypothetical protein [Chlorobiota bacterium]